MPAPLFTLFCEDVFSDCGDDLTGIDPLVCRTLGVVIVDRAAGRIPAVHGVLCGLERGIGDRLIELAVHDGGKRAFLVDHARDGVRERRVLDPVEDDGAYRDLTVIGFAARLGGNDLCQQILVVRITARAPCGAVLDPHGRQRFGARDSIHSKAVALLKQPHRSSRLRAEDPVDGAGIVPPVFELLLDLRHLFAPRALPGKGR